MSRCTSEPPWQLFWMKLNEKLSHLLKPVSLSSVLIFYLVQVFLYIQQWFLLPLYADLEILQDILFHASLLCSLSVLYLVFTFFGSPKVENPVCTFNFLVISSLNRLVTDAEYLILL